MRILLFGASGMVGQGVLRECLAAPDVDAVVAVTRRPLGVHHAKLVEVVHEDHFDLAPIADRLVGVDACLFCTGVSSAGMSEADYTRATYDLTLACARALAAASPGARFVYVSGAGTDSSERGPSMWARVKGRTENALLRLDLEAYMFRPGYIHPRDGIRSKTRLYRAAYAVIGPFYPLLRRLMPEGVVDTREVGEAMLAVARAGAPGRVLESADIARLARAPPKPT